MEDHVKELIRAVHSLFCATSSDYQASFEFISPEYSWRLGGGLDVVVRGSFSQGRYILRVNGVEQVSEVSLSGFYDALVELSDEEFNRANS